MDKSPLLHVLTHAARIVTIPQAALFYRNARDPYRAAAAHVARLDSAGLVNVSEAMVQPLCPTMPLFEWRKDDAEFDASAIANQNARRWQVSAVRTKFVAATSKAAKLTGGPLPGRRRLRPTDLAHDAALAWVYLLQYHRRDSIEWRHEDAACEANCGNVPDAVVSTPWGEIAIELVGRSYSARRLAAIHRAYRHAPYVLW